jgi:hypothetical protein
VNIILAKTFISSYPMSPITSINPSSNPYIRQHYAMLREVFAHVRWLKRACAVLLIVNIVGGLILWLVKHPQSVGF